MSQTENKFNRRRIRTGFLTSTVSIALVLVVIGIFGIQLIWVKNQTDQIKTEFTLRIELKKGTPDSVVFAFKDVLAQKEEVAEITYIDEAQAALDFSKMVGEDFVDFLGYNPLPATLEIKFKPPYADASKLQKFKADVLNNISVQSAEFPESDLNKINRNIQRFGLILLGIGAILIVIAISLINNTIRLIIYSRRLLIKTMLLVGATKAFIRKPFLLSGTLQGLLGGILAVALLTGIYLAGENQFEELKQSRDYMLLGALAGSIVILGAALSFICTFFAVHKYIHLKSDKIF
jgi:cell division transport system permease protein